DTLVRRPGTRSRRRAGPVTPRCRFRSGDARARADPQAGGGGGGGRRRDRQARRAGGSRHVRGARLARLLRGTLGKGRRLAGCRRPHWLRRLLLGRVPCSQVRGPDPDSCRAARHGARAVPAVGARVVNAAVRTASGTYLVDLETEEVIGETDDFEAPSVKVELPRVVAAATAGATVVAVVDRRPPLAVSHDAGSTWHEA